jgi:hypothetical protein
LLFVAVAWLAAEALAALLIAAFAMALTLAGCKPVPTLRKPQSGTISQALI